MATTVLPVGLIGGDRMDITYDEPDLSDQQQLFEHVISTFAQDSGVLRSKHGDRLIVLYGRGVAAVEVAPRGAVLRRAPAHRVCSRPALATCGPRYELSHALSAAHRFVSSPGVALLTRPCSKGSGTARIPPRRCSRPCPGLRPSRDLCISEVYSTMAF